MVNFKLDLNLIYMKSNLTQDIVPITDLMHHAGDLIHQLKQTKRPILITQNGRAAMICVGVEEYQKQLRKFELIDAILRGEKAFAEGDFSSWNDFEKRLDKM